MRALHSLRRWLRRGIDTHVSAPLFSLLLLGAIWGLTWHMIENDRATAQEAAADSLRELLDTYEAQVARGLAGIDQNLKVLKYAVELKGALGALPELQREGLLPPGVVFVVSIVDREGRTVASNPAALPLSVADQDYFKFHRNHDSGATYVSQARRDQANLEWHLHFTRRLNDARGQFAGIVIVEADPAYFTSSYEHGRLGEQGLLAVVGADGVARSLRVGDKVSFGQSERSRPGAGVEASGWDYVRRYGASRELYGSGLRIEVGLAESEQMAGFERQRRARLWEASFASIGLVLLAGLVWLWAWQGARNRRRVRRAQENYAAASEASMDAFFMLREVRDGQDRIVDFIVVAANSRAERMTGYSKQELQGMALLHLLPEARANGVFDLLVRGSRAGGVHEAEWDHYAHRTGKRWLHQQVVRVEDGVVAIVRDITERKLAEERMLHMARHDTLTGLPNRSLIADRLSQAILQAQRSGGAVLVAFIDLDGFKLVNDGLGHNAGDELLKVVAGRMDGCVRGADTVGRFGGDEFVLVLPEQPDGAAATVIERIRQAVLKPIQLGGQEVQVSCSIGVAVYPRDGADTDTLLMNADSAMYRAKETGKNNCQFYTQEMNASLEEKLALLDGLRCALAQGQFRVVYQPKVELRTGHMFGAEALVRWQHPQHGMVGPDRFIPLAEESGMIVALGEWVLRSACLQARAWQEAGLPPLRVSVNVSARQFEDAQLVQRVAAALAHSGLEPRWLELEVTESLIMRDMQKSVARMAQLKDMGVSLSIDDFGTGYSSLSALKSFPISTLKIDKSFVRDLATNADDQAIASAIIALAHRLHLRVIAEGVETEQQRGFLHDNGCDEMQGYLFSRPLPPEALGQLLARQVAGAPMMKVLAPPGPRLVA
ncbi:EAL domain-containing protein [Oxalobacteraceae bacterium A2-2]